VPGGAWLLFLTSDFYARLTDHAVRWSDVGDATQYIRVTVVKADLEPQGQSFAIRYSPSMKRRVSQESLPGPMQRIAMSPSSMQKSVRPSCIAGQNPW
jgi:hypothetical protein